jgi:hypothetical protein
MNARKLAFFSVTERGGLAPKKKSAVTEGQSHFRTSGGIAAKNSARRFVYLQMSEGDG